MTTSTPNSSGDVDRGRPEWAVSLLARATAHSQALIVIISLLAGGMAALIASRGGDEISFSDENDYLTLSVSLADSGFYSLDGQTATAYRPPGLSALLSLVARVSPELTTLRVANALLFGLAVFIAAQVATRLSGRLAGVLTAAGTAAAPVGLFTATKLYPQTLATVLLISALGAVLAVERSDAGRRQIGWAIASGVLLASLTLTVPNHGITAVVGTMWLLWRLRRAALVPVAVVLVAFMLPLGAWTLRNHSSMDALVFVSTNGGVNLLLGNTDGTGAGTGTNVDISDDVSEADRRGLDEVEKDKFLRDEAVRWMGENPADAAQLFVAKVANNFTVQQELATADEQPSTTETLLIAVTYLPVLALFLVRPLLRRRVPLRVGEGLLIAVFWANVLATAVAFTRIRFRVPLDPVMVVVAATLVAGLLEGWFGAAPERDPNNTTSAGSAPDRSREDLPTEADPSEAPH